MKRIATVLLCAMMLGCASAPVIRKGADVSPLGFVSVMSNNDITWYGEEKESGGLLGNMLEKKVDAKTGENAMELLPYAESALREALSAKGITMLEASKITGSEVYAMAKEDALAKKSGMIVPSGYRFVAARDSGLLKGLVSATGLKSGLYVNFNFQKVMDAGVEKNGTAKACVTMNVVLLGEDGKAITQKSFYASSGGTYGIVAGVYKIDALMALFPDAISQVCSKFASEFEM